MNHSVYRKSHIRSLFLKLTKPNEKVYKTHKHIVCKKKKKKMMYRIRSDIYTRYSTVYKLLDNIPSI